MPDTAPIILIASLTNNAIMLTWNVAYRHCSSWLLSETDLRSISAYFSASSRRNLSGFPWSENRHARSGVGVVGVQDRVKTAANVLEPLGIFLRFRRALFPLRG